MKPLHLCCVGLTSLLALGCSEPNSPRPRQVSGVDAGVGDAHRAPAPETDAGYAPPRSDAAPPPDGARLPDAATLDVGASDAARPGAGRPDSAPSDAACPDAGPPDMLPADMGSPLFYDPAELPVPCSPNDAEDVIAPEAAADFQLVATTVGVASSAPVDLDGDGVCEVFATVSQGDYMGVVGYSFIGGVAAQTWPVTHGLPLAVGDIDGDGTPDVVTLAMIPEGEQPDGSYSRTLERAFLVRRMDAGNDLEAATLLATIQMSRAAVPPIGLSYPAQAWLLDADGDGADEMFSSLPAEVRRWQNGELVRFAVDYDEDERDFLFHDLFGAEVVDDFDGDGVAEAVTVELILPRQGGPLSVTRVVELGADGEYHRRFREPMPAVASDFAASGDFHGHGRRDFLRGGVTNNFCTYFATYRATANDTYERYWERSLLVEGDWFGGEADAGDTDGDGRDEIMINNGHRLWIYEADDSIEGEGFRLVFELTYQNCGRSCSALVALKDVTGDGRADIVVSRNPDRPDDIPEDGIQVYSRVLAR